MKAKHFLFLFVTISMFYIASSAISDTGAFYSSGDTLFPIEETSISLDKEHLQFELHRKNGIAISVTFTLLNPGSDKELTLGFVSSAGEGYKVPSDKPNIDNFSIQLNGQSIDYTILQYDGKGPKTLDQYAQEGDFVYKFQANLKGGKNTLVHTYLFHGWTDGANCFQENVFPYRLITGLSWANRKINDFELTISSKGEMLVTIPASLDNQGDQWQVSGLCKKHPGRLESFGSRRDIYKPVDVYFNGGSVNLRKADFVPKRDMLIHYFPAPQDLIFYSWRTSESINSIVSPAIWDLVFFTMPWCGEGARDTDTIRKLNLTKHELRIMRNAFFARTGYSFKDNTLANYFRNFIWYEKDSAPISTEITQDIRNFISLLQDIEKDE